jgi:hypothetical protein
MSKGFLIFAENSKTCDYVEQAYGLALSIKNTQTAVSNVSIVTNNKLTTAQQKVFDHVIEIPWVNNNIESRYKSEHRWKLFHVSPYNETIVLDSDMLFLDDVADWWDYCAHHELKFCSKIKNYKQEVIEKDMVHRRAFIDNQLTNPYFALHYFRKTSYYKQISCC